jgi:predicted amidohydrolase YtcJ
MFACAILLTATALAIPEPADLIVINANVLTMDAKLSAAEALAVRAGKFASVGSNADIKALAGPQTSISISAARP